jgi:hypothetical protein
LAWYEEIIKNELKAKVEVEDKVDEIRNEKVLVESEVKNQQNDKAVAATAEEER